MHLEHQTQRGVVIDDKYSGHERFHPVNDNRMHRGAEAPKARQIRSSVHFSIHSRKVERLTGLTRKSFMPALCERCR